MKRLIIILLALTLVFFTASCSQIADSSKETECPTQEITEEPTIEPTPEPTQRPTLVPYSTKRPSPEPTPEEIFEVGSEKVLYFLGHASFRLELSDGRVIYIDPYFGGEEDYAKEADLVLVTHQHNDHNLIEKVTLKENGRVIECPYDIIAGEVIETKGVHIRAVEAYGGHHLTNVNCGYVITIDDLVIYHSGDTKITDEMDEMAQYEIDYALLAISLIHGESVCYVLSPLEAMIVADKIQAKYVIPMHTSTIFRADDPETIAQYTKDNKIVPVVGEPIVLEE